MTVAALRRPAALVALLLVGCRPAAGDRPGDALAGGIRWDRPIEVARGGGTKGPWQQNASTFDYVDDPSVALAADGAVVVAWVDHRDKDVHVRVRAPDGGWRTAATNVSRTPEVFSWLPRVAISPRDPRDVLVLWQEIVFSGGSHGGDIFAARSRDGGATFAPPRNLSRSVAGDGKGRIDARTWHNGSLDLALAEDGTAYAAWTTYEGGLFVAWSADGGTRFTTPVRVAGSDAEPARAPSLAVAPTKRVFLAWTIGEHAEADVRVASAEPVAASARDREAAPALRFDAPVLAAVTPTYADAPKLAIDRRGTVHLVWAETAGGPFARPHVRYARSRDAGRTFGASRRISGAGGAAFPALALDRDHVVVSWEVATEPRGILRGLGVAVSHDRGTAFSAPAAIPGSRGPDGGTNGSHQGHLMRKLAVRDGAVVVANASLAPGRGSRVWLLRGTLRAPR